VGFSESWNVWWLSICPVVIIEADTNATLRSHRIVEFLSTESIWIIKDPNYLGRGCDNGWMLGLGGRSLRGLC
jgi:hypothetical protein